MAQEKIRFLVDQKGRRESVVLPIVERAALDYEPIRVVMVSTLTSKVSREGQSSRQVANRLNEEAWETLDSQAEEVFSKPDKIILMEVLQEQARFASLVDNCPPENKPFLLAALIDGYWSIQKLDLCTSTALAMVSG